MKRMIFHLPNYIDSNRKSASHLRPVKLKKAFEDLGYQVDFVSGYAKDRAKTIKEIKKNIKNGIKYDFCYSESSTMPTLLTEKHHLPTHPFLDFSFFKYLKKRNIKTGLFLRDIHWMFDEYKKRVTGIKGRLAIQMYKYDLKKYEEIEKIYIPSMKMAKYLPVNLQNQLSELPPGIDDDYQEPFMTDAIRMIYVGGLGNLYDLREFVKAVNDSDMSFKLITRAEEWHSKKDIYPKLKENIELFHIAGNRLEDEYKRMNLGVLALAPQEYLSFAIPYKLFEYIEHNLPIIATRATAFGEFVEKENIGYVVENTEQSYTELLKSLTMDDIKEKSDKILAMKKNHSWKARAMKVAEDLN